MNLWLLTAVVPAALTPSSAPSAAAHTHRTTQTTTQQRARDVHMLLSHNTRQRYSRRATPPNLNILDDAIAAAQKAASEAAMQNVEQMDLAADKLTGNPEPLPDSFEDSVTLALDATNAALDAGANRIILEFDTAAGDETYPLLSRTMKLVEPYLGRFAELEPMRTRRAPAADDEGPLPLQLLFPDEGTAALVLQKWKLPPGTLCRSMGRAPLAPRCAALLIIAPSATDVPAVKRLLDEADGADVEMPFILFNPKLVDMQSTGYGLVGRELRSLVQTSFEPAYVLKTYMGGALHRRYPGDYTLWRESADEASGYDCRYAGYRRPSQEEIEEGLSGDEADGGGGEGGGGFFSGLSQFIRGFQAL